jgi:membrane associated rhomboid family serine protease
VNVAALVEVFRSQHRRPCEERALVLTAVGISSIISLGPQCYILQVDEPNVPQAQAQLKLYEAENRPVARPTAPVLHPHAWLGSLGYAACLLAVARAISEGHLRPDAFDTGELYAAQVKNGEWWRAWTALTLHLDGPHLAANLAVGVWFGYLAGRYIGTGTAWFLIVTGGALANLTEGLLGPPDHRSVGASTAVFTALGLMAAYSWRERLQLRQRWALRWAPLVAGVSLLGWLGSSGEGTDLVAHVLGFGVGAVLGASAALPRARALLDRIPGWLGGLAAIASVLIAWGFALAS